MKTMRELREKECILYENLESGSLKSKDAVEMNNAAGKIINSTRTQMEYAKLRNEKPEIDFMKCK